MVRAIITIFLLILLYPFAECQERNCSCLNGESCLPGYFSSPCVCPPLMIGKYCQTQGLQWKGQPDYFDLNFNFKHLVFSPEEGNLFKFTFNVCMISNPEDLECLIFLTSDQEDGSPSYDPPIISSAKIKVREGTCLSFSSPYIEIKKNTPHPFRRIIIGVRTLEKSIYSYFYRTVPGKVRQEMTHDMLKGQPLTSAPYQQRLFYSVQYEQYKETFMETVIRKLIKVVIGVGIVIALCLFCKIALFSYGIDTKDWFLRVHRMFRSIWRRICPRQGDRKSFRNYLRYHASEGEQEMRFSGRDECAICLQVFTGEDLVEQTACRHIYHESCLEEWQAKKEFCPLCRQKMKRSQGKWINHVFKV